MERINLYAQITRLLEKVGLAHMLEIAARAMTMTKGHGPDLPGWVIAKSEADTVLDQMSRDPRLAIKEIDRNLNSE